MKCPPERTLLRALKKQSQTTRGGGGSRANETGKYCVQRKQSFSLFFSCVLRFVSADARGVENCNLNRGGRTEEESFAPFFLGLFVCLFVSLSIGRFIGAGF